MYLPSENITKRKKELLRRAFGLEKSRLLQQVENTFLESSIDKWRESVAVYVIRNEEIEQQFRNKIITLKEQKVKVQEVFAFQECQASDVCKKISAGASIDETQASFLGPSNKGIHLQRHMDVCVSQRNRATRCLSLTILMYKVALGRIRFVSPNCPVLPEPTLNYNVHLPRASRNTVVSSMIYVYDHDEEGLVKSPSQCLPYAVLVLEPPSGIESIFRDIPVWKTKPHTQKVISEEGCSTPTKSTKRHTKSDSEVVPCKVWRGSNDKSVSSNKVLECECKKFLSTAETINLLTPEEVQLYDSFNLKPAYVPLQRVTYHNIILPSMSTAASTATSSIYAPASCKVNKKMVATPIQSSELCAAAPLNVQFTPSKALNLIMDSQGVQHIASSRTWSLPVSSKIPTSPSYLDRSPIVNTKMIIEPTANAKMRAAAPTVNTKMTTAPTVNTKMTTAPTLTNQMNIAPILNTNLTTAPTVNTKMTTAPTLTSQVNIAPTLNNNLTTAPTVNTKMTTAPTVNTKMTTAPTLTNQMNIAPILNTNLTTAPTVNTKMTTAPTVYTKMTTAPTLTNQMNIAPTLNTNLTTAPTVNTKMTTAPTLTNQMNIAPTLNTNLTTAPTVNTKMTTAPTLTSQVNIAPTLNTNWTTAPTVNTKMTTAPTLTNQMNIAPTLNTKLTTAPTVNTKMTTAPALTNQMNISPTLNTNWTTAPTVNTKMTTAPTLTSQVNIAPTLNTNWTTVNTKMTTVPKNVPNSPTYLAMMPTITNIPGKMPVFPKAESKSPPKITIQSLTTAVHSAVTCLAIPVSSVPITKTVISKGIDQVIKSPSSVIIEASKADSSSMCGIMPGVDTLTNVGGKVNVVSSLKSRLNVGEKTASSVTSKMTTIPTVSKMTTAPTSNTKMITGPTANIYSSTAPTMTSKMTTALTTNAKMRAAPTGKTRMTTLPCILRKRTAPTVNTKITYVPTVNPKTTTAPTGNTKMTTAHTVNTKMTTAPNVTTKMITEPNVNTKMTTAANVNTKMITEPNVTTKITYVPTVNPKMTTVPTVASKMTTVPTVNTKMTTSPTGNPNMTKVRWILKNRITAPTANTNFTAAPTVNTKMTTAPNVTTKMTIAPTMTSKMTTEPNVNTKMTAAPNVTTKMTTAPNVNTKMTTAHNVNTKMTTASTMTSKMNSAPTLNTNLTTAPNVTTYMTTATTVNTKMTTAHNVSTKMTTAHNVNTKMTTANNVTTKMTTANNVTTKMTTANNVTTKMTTANNVNTKMTTAPNVNTKMKTANNVTTKMTTANNVNTKMTTGPTVNTKMTTAPTVNSKMTTAHNVTTTMTSAPNVTTKMTTAPNVTTKMTTANNVTTKMTTAPTVTTKMTNTSSVTREERMASSLASRQTYYSVNNTSVHGAIVPTAPNRSGANSMYIQRPVIQDVCRPALRDSLYTQPMMMSTGTPLSCDTLSPARNVYACPRRSVFDCKINHPPQQTYTDSSKEVMQTLMPCRPQTALISPVFDSSIHNKVETETAHIENLQKKRSETLKKMDNADVLISLNNRVKQAFSDISSSPTCTKEDTSQLNRHTYVHEVSQARSQANSSVQEYFALCGKEFVSQYSGVTAKYTDHVPPDPQSLQEFMLNISESFTLFIDEYNECKAFAHHSTAIISMLKDNDQKMAHILNIEAKLLEVAKSHVQLESKVLVMESLFRSRQMPQSPWQLHQLAFYEQRKIELQTLNQPNTQYEIEAQIGFLEANRMAIESCVLIPTLPVDSPGHDPKFLVRLLAGASPPMAKFISKKLEWAMKHHTADETTMC